MTEKSKNKKRICKRAEQKQPESTEALVHNKTLACLSIESFKYLSSWSPVHEVSTMLQTRLKCIFAPMEFVKRQKLKYTFYSFCFIYRTLMIQAHRGL